MQEQIVICRLDVTSWIMPVIWSSISSGCWELCKIHHVQASTLSKFDNDLVCQLRSFRGTTTPCPSQIILFKMSQGCGPPEQLWTLRREFCSEHHQHVPDNHFVNWRIHLRYKMKSKIEDESIWSHKRWNAVACWCHYCSQVMQPCGQVEAYLI